jgi:DNA-binding transcriptional MerR regulator
MDKAPDAFRTISEVAAEIDVPQHVLRFWESRFHEIRPMKRGGGRRFYRPQDIDLLRGIRYLLYGEGYTIRGVQRILREQGQRFVQQVWQPGAPQPTRSVADGASDDETDRSGAVAADEELPTPRAASAPTEDDAREEAEGRHRASEPAGLPARGPAFLSAHQTRELRAVLDELTECRRLLDAASSVGPTE